MTASWLIPILAYVVMVGALGLFGKLALRSLSWQELIVWTTVVYAFATAFFLLSGQVNLHFEGNTWWALAGGVAAVGSLLTLYLALGHGEAGTILSISAAYPVVTLTLSAIFLAESISPGKAIGVGVVIGGVVLVTLSS